MGECNGSGWASTAHEANRAPGWVRGLRQLYGDVVDTPMPAELADLMRRLQGNAPRNGPGRRL